MVVLPPSSDGYVWLGYMHDWLLAYVADIRLRWKCAQSVWHEVIGGRYCYWSGPKEGRKEGLKFRSNILMNADHMSLVGGSLVVPFRA